MKRLVVFCSVAAAVAALPASHALLANGGGGGNGNKILVCHITELTTRGEVQGTDDPTPVFHGHLISVSPNAVPAHCRHGDHNGYQLLHPRRVRHKGDPCGRAVRGNGPGGMPRVYCGRVPGYNWQIVVDPPWYNPGN